MHVILLLTLPLHNMSSFLSLFKFAHEITSFGFLETLTRVYKIGYINTSMAIMFL